jgi:excisionase family DNA binding protein
MPEYLKIIDVAEKFGVNRNTVTNWARRGIIPAMRLGQKLQFDPQEIDAWVQRSRRCRLYLSPNVEIDLSQYAPNTVDLVRPGELFVGSRKRNLTNFTVFIGTIEQAEELLKKYKGVLLES